jgi:hypothetical protein
MSENIFALSNNPTAIAEGTALHQPLANLTTSAQIFNSQGQGKNQNQNVSSPTPLEVNLLTRTVPTSLTEDITLKKGNNNNLPDLTVKFNSIVLPDSIDFGDTGTVRLTVSNSGGGRITAPITIYLYNSTDGDIDSNDGLLGSYTFNNLNLRPGQSTTLNLEYSNLSSIVSPGSYQIIAQVDPLNQIPERRENNNVASQLVSAPGTDVVLDWNSVALNAIQAEGKAGRGVPPTSGSRLLAMLSTAVYDTVSAITGELTPYAVNLNAPRGISLEAAVVGAAYRVLSSQLPRQAGLLSQALTYSLAEIQDLPGAEARGLRFGNEVADKILQLRSQDGSDNNAPYVPPSGDYVWRPDAPRFTAVGPNWGQVKPWAIGDVESFAPDGLDGTPTGNPLLYAQEIEEVRLLGGREDTSLTTVQRTADQTEIAIFWAYDRADTFRPYGQLNQITQEIALREGNSLVDNARLFAALNVSLADAAIVAWDAKYTFNQPRPDDVIAGGIAANDGLTNTVADPDWRPLLPTPPFPDYISGHSTFAGAWAGVLSEFFGDNYSFTAVSQELLGVTRSFNSFTEAAFEDAISRVYGGVHVREATVTDALPVGLEIGNFVAENFFTPIL